MKRSLFVILFAASAVLMFAQTEKAIGVRFGAGGEISYQQPVGASNRIEFDLGLSPQSFGINGIYHWVNDLSSWTEGMYWYYGPGIAAGFSNTSALYPVSKLAVGVVGQIGLEYRFEFPLQLSVDYRPAFYLMGPAGSIGSYGDICLSARYRF